MHGNSTAGPGQKAHIHQFYIPLSASLDVMATLAMQADNAVGRVVVPGECLTSLPATGTIRVGGGVQQAGNSLVASKAGLVQRGPGGALWVSSAQRRYTPSTNDAVVGIITHRHSENYTADILGPGSAILPTLAFEGVARRNRPNLQLGDVVYCRVEEAARDVDPVLTCVDETGKASGFGPLKGGTVFRVSTQHARRLATGPPFLSLLGRALKFELAVGANGRVWVSSPSEATMALISRICQAAEGLSDQQATAMAQTRLDKERGL